MILNGLPLAGMPGQSWLRGLQGQAMTSDRVLVLIKLNGGNDGLNTLIPLDVYDTMAALRPEIVAPAHSVLKLDDQLGMHPAMKAMHALYQEGKVGIVRDVGYPNPDFSHFRSSDILMSGTDARHYAHSGWLGRYLDQAQAGRNRLYPMAITVGGLASNTCQGRTTNRGIAITEDVEAYEAPATGYTQALAGAVGKELSYVSEVQQATADYLDAVRRASRRGRNRYAQYPDSELASQLAMVARLISGGLQTRIYMLSLDGFDTHAAQVESDEPTAGIHAELLGQLSEAIYAFQQDLKLLGEEDRVMGMTYSEFGRRIKANESRGTDHGTSGPIFCFGTGIKAGYLGKSPLLDKAMDEEDNLAMQYDYRSVYAAILQDWFGLGAEQSAAVLFRSFKPVPLIA